MKNIIIAVLAFFSFVVINAQDYNRWSLGLETGMHSISDESATVRDNNMHIGGNLRYNINEVLGVGLTSGYDKLDLISVKHDIMSVDFYRAGLEAFISASEILRLRHKYLNFLVHGGAGVAIINGLERENVMNVTGGVTGLLKLSNRLSLTLGYKTSVHLSQDRTLDGQYDITNAGINSVVDNLTIGLTTYFGKSKVHADFYEAPKPVYNLIQNLYTSPDTYINYVINNTYSAEESVFFENDSYVVGINGLNAIEKVANLLKLDPNTTVDVTGHASPTSSTTYYYDSVLSKNRAEAVRNKIVSLGIDSSRVNVQYNGKDFNRTESHDMARRVSLIVK